MKLFPLHIRLSELLVVLSMIALVTATFTQVALRYAFNYSLPWAVELARVSLVWLVFSGMALCFARGQHAVVGMLLDRYHGRAGRLACLFVDMLVFVLFVVVLYGGAQLVFRTSGQTTSGLGISRGLVYASVPLGAALMLIELIRQNILRFRPPRPEW
jgi:TRAP-type C4-dicarboxylate transport system permease small subunit